MIVDTSALVAILANEPGSAPMLMALADERGTIPAPVCVEFLRVASGSRHRQRQHAEDLLARLEQHGCTVLAFSAAHARLAMTAEPVHGSGNATGGLLNLLDLMVYAVAKARGEPVLCTGKDFAATDIALHPASRPY
jgi:ribonuclease VapC